MSTAERLVVVINTLCTSPWVTDTIWLPGQCTGTVCEELAAIAMDEHGASEADILRALHGEYSTAAVVEGHSSI